MTNITKLFNQLRKDGVHCKQKAACCPGCVEDSTLQVITTTQTDLLTFDHDVADKILLAAAKVGVAILWNGNVENRMEVL